jgi:hypothetical protein
MKNCSGIILGAVFIILAPLINSNRDLGTATSTALLGSLTSEIHEELRWDVRPPHSRMLNFGSRWTVRILSMDYISYEFSLLSYFVYIKFLFFF